MRELVLTPKFKRAFRKFVQRNAKLQKQIEDTLGAYSPSIWGRTNWKENYTGYEPVLVAMIAGLYSQ